VPILLMKLAIFLGVLGLWGCSYRCRSSKHGVSLNLHEDTFGVCGEPGVDYIELWPPILGLGISMTTIKIVIPRDSSLFQGVGVVNSDLRGTNKVLAFLKASAKVASFCSAKENLKHLLLRPLGRRCMPPHLPDLGLTLPLGRSA